VTWLAPELLEGADVPCSPPLDEALLKLDDVAALGPESSTDSVDKGVDGAVESCCARGINGRCRVDEKRILNFSRKALVRVCRLAVEISHR
jgi:hypothetical protein